jgi:hypothetical protein
METMHAAGRRRLPPVPRLSDQAGTASPAGPAEQEMATERFVLGPPTGERPALRPATRRATRQRAAASAPPGPATDVDQPADAAAAALADGPELDAAQRFVARLRAAAADFAEAAGATSAVVREAVPPARHRRSRCRMVLRYADGSEADMTFLGPAGSPSGAASRHGFDRQIRRWLGAGQRREDAWLVSDPDVPGGLAVDVTAWLAAD